MLPTKFQGLSVQEEKQKIYFQDGSNGSHLGFLIRTILTIFDLQVTPYFLPSFKLTGLSVQENQQKTDFQDGGHGAILDFRLNDFSYF